MNMKAWLEVKSLRFSYLQHIQYLVVMEFGAIFVLSPTNQYNADYDHHSTAADLV